MKNRLFITMLSGLAVLLGIAGGVYANVAVIQWNFGTDADGWGGLTERSFIAQSAGTENAWILAADYVGFRTRKSGTTPVFVDFGAFIDMSQDPRWTPGADFTISMTGLARVAFDEYYGILAGLVALGDGQLGTVFSGSASTIGNSQYLARIQRPTTTTGRLMPITRGGTTLSSTVPTKQMIGGTEYPVTMELEGTYAQDGKLTLKYTVSYMGGIWTTTAPANASPLVGSRFGAGGRLRGYNNSYSWLYLDTMEIRFVYKAGTMLIVR